MAERLFAELAPAGELEGFLVADLAAAMWRTGRARRLEAQALAGDEPDAAKLDLALRYQGSASRELFRLLRALHGLRHRPLTAEPAQAPEAEEPVALAMAPAGDAPDEILPEVAELAWGGGATVPPPPPPGCLMLRPIPYHRPRQWHCTRSSAFPATARVPVDAQGTVYALVGGRWEPRPWSMEPEPTWPRVASQRPNEPSQAVDPAAISCQPPAAPDPLLLTPRHGLSWTRSRPARHADGDAAPARHAARPAPRHRRAGGAREPPAGPASVAATPAQLGERLWEGWTRPPGCLAALQAVGVAGPPVAPAPASARRPAPAAGPRQ